MKLYIIFSILLLVGCSSAPKIEYINITHTNTINNTIYQDRIVEVIKYVNTTEPCFCNDTYSPTYFLSLIKQIKVCEAQLASDWNITECEWEITRLNHSLTVCNTSLNTIRDVLD